MPSDSFVNRPDPKSKPGDGPATGKNPSKAGASPPTKEGKSGQASRSTKSDKKDKPISPNQSSKPTKPSSSEGAAKPASQIDRPEGQRGKGHATPSRKQIEQARSRPLVGAGKTPSLTKDQRKEANRQARERYNQAMRTGEERYLPARDKGPVKRYIRNYIDSQRTISEYFIWVIVGMLLLTLLIQQAFPLLAGYVAMAMYLFFFAVIFEVFLRSRRLKKHLIEKFGRDNLPRGAVGYGLMRSVQFRRSRMPKPQVERGQSPN